MNLKTLTKRFGVWLLISFLVLLFGIVRWDVPPATALFLAGTWGLIIFLRLDLANDKDSTVIEEITSSDGSVIATIQEWDDKTSDKYIGKVKRNYQDGVFAKEKAFEDLEKAKQWVTATYKQELEKHQQRNHHSKHKFPTSNQ